MMSKSNLESLIVVVLEVFTMLVDIEVMVVDSVYYSSSFCMLWYSLG